ncbi:sugar phosphate nucleotidyltransferase [Leptospira noguchii]|uniref:sugar phosphate nucleotidyltransferase n=1 Tax=Leptospira noguchii TaxID=28182 RepID=UPI0011461679|nr:sugar phosphate nucleotidyltransferase [Leptospira noguchii]TQE72326.1 nucleotidyltransferase family protein [Leptospira noguchii]UOG30131.1 NTP transferase domain-containing protein [Leptospira noguchii]UOG52355.1 NTP transferase domain-containing protein [Leptospira noguchii]
MKFFIPAAGFGTRMKELTKNIPKPLLTINGIPLIYYTLFQAWKQNAEVVIINIHYLGEKIRKELETFSLFPLVFSEEKKEILGTAGGIRTGLERAGWMGETIGIINPDFLYFPEHFFQMPNTLSEEECLLYLLPQPKMASYTGIELKNGKILFGKGNLFYVGISVLNSNILDKILPETFFDLSQIFQELSVKQKLGGEFFPGDAFDLGEKEYYLSLKDRDFSERLGSSWKEFLELCRLPKTK